MNNEIFDEIYDKLMENNNDFNPDMVENQVLSYNDEKSAYIELDYKDKHIRIDITIEYNLPKKYTYAIDLNERGYFNAHVEDENGNVVYSLSNENTVIVLDEETGEETEQIEYGKLWTVEMGFMKHCKDYEGLHKYLVDIEILDKDSVMDFRG